MTTTPRTGTRKALGIAAGDRITVETHLGLVTGTVLIVAHGWTLVDRDTPGHLPSFGHATRVTVHPTPA